jgi:two-component system, LuxR family, sensor kinase FixL
MFSKHAQALMEAAVDAIVVIDHHGRITAVNDATCRTFGYRTDELLGENVSLLMPEPDRSAHDGYMQRYLATGTAKIIGIGRQVTARRKNGSLFPARLSVGRVADSAPPRFVGLLRDVTAENEAMAALQLERDRARAFLELNDSILLELDATRRVYEVNTRGSELLGAAVPEIIGRDWLTFFRDESERERALLLLESALQSGSSREREFDGIDMTGAPRRIYWRCIGLRSAGGAPAGWLCAGSDITDRAEREQHMHLAQDRLTRVARLATMGEMAAGVAHELNQPLTAITTYARACERYLERSDPDMADVREAVREINAEGLRAGEIIRRLRQMVRVDAPDERVPVTMSDIIEELRSLLQSDAKAHDATLNLDISNGLPPIEGNAVQLQQVILNLVRNALEALQAHPAGSREVTLSVVRTPAGDVELRVSDNGPGVDPKVKDNLFDPFTTTKSAGTGLGLAISRTIVQGHGGTIGTREIEPHGTTFYVRLPVAEVVYR